MAKKIYWLWVCLVGVGCGLLAQDSNKNSALMQMVETEREFGRLCAAIGQRDATMLAMADDGILFRPTPMNGKAALRASKPSPLILKFDQEFADMAASEDFGYTSGPWEFQGALPLQPPLEYGYFATIWKKQAAGGFKVAVALAVDIGAAMPKNYQYKLSYPENADQKREYTPVANVVAESEVLLKLDETNAGKWTEAPTAETFLAFLAPEARVFRKGKFPMTNANDIRALFNAKERFSWKPMQSDVARSGDLGYTYGSYQIEREDGNSETGHYLRFWKRKKGEGWKIVVDLTKSLNSFSEKS